MRVMSFMRQGSDLVPIEIELTLQPGLPQFHFLGLPDASVRESALRIRSAIREQGFRMPQAQQVLVQLKPNHLRKHSLGLDLAIAAALLWETEQVPQPDEPMPVLYGALSLRGEVEAPADVPEISVSYERAVLTGKLSEKVSFASRQLGMLSELSDLPLKEPGVPALACRRPEPRVDSFSREVADLGAVIAAGEHSALLAGPAGSGKSTLIDSIPAWLAPPREEHLPLARKFARANQCDIWRPVVRPHQTISRMAMIGGGSGWPGEISRAHTGALLMDELLRFSAETLESLREPVETGTISIARGGKARTYPADFLLLATTNLCLCGKFVPGSELTDCKCPRRSLLKTLQRLSGPFADRFAILAYSDRWDELPNDVPSIEIATRVATAIRFRRETRAQEHPNGILPVAALEASLGTFQRKHLLGSIARGSYRRREACLRVARTFADLDAQEVIRNVDLDRALRLGQAGHARLAEWQD
jgi:magnesium chelatase family protein